MRDPPPVQDTADPEPGKAPADWQLRVEHRLKTLELTTQEQAEELRAVRKENVALKAKLTAVETFRAVDGSALQQLDTTVEKHAGRLLKLEKRPIPRRAAVWCS